ncbi:MAG: hypothetical protein KIS63_03025 [Caldilineales bacterium]|nr:hypothetical protein [Caldilineales bacterium]
MRRRRKALDSTQEELAQRAGCAVVSLQHQLDERHPRSSQQSGWSWPGPPQLTRLFFRCGETLDLRRLPAALPPLIVARPPATSSKHHILLVGF